MAEDTKVVESSDEIKFSEEELQGLVAQLNEKYGPGSLNPETGVFTPTAETPES
jgi:hypothetical protein